MSIKPKDDTYGETLVVAERAERQRRYAHLFAQAMSTTDSVKQARIIKEIRAMLKEAEPPYGRSSYGQDDG